MNLTTKEWLNEIKRNKKIRESKHDSTINFGSNKSKQRRKEVKKATQMIIREFKRKLGRKLDSAEINHCKSIVRH